MEESAKHAAETVVHAAARWDLVAAAFGAALSAIAAGYGIGKIASAAVESIARQPEAAADIRGATVLTAAFIEGVCLFACVICLLIKLL
jgi:F-type H+-transporting ATPase subunit c